MPLRRIRVGAQDYVDALPAAIAACEAPLYNLHPVSRHLLARAVRADGHTTLISGDGADEIFRGDSGADYLPLVGALTRAAGLTALAPFLAPPLASVAPDPDKHELRRLARVVEQAGQERVVLGFDRPLDPAWRIADPLSLRREPGDEALTLATNGDGELLSLPVEWSGDLLELSVDLTLADASRVVAGKIWDDAPEAS